MASKKKIIIGGFALFSMFFGSGNLVFPLYIGNTSLDHYTYATLGLLITGVIVPFVGIMSISYFHGDKDKYFISLGRHAPFIIYLILASLQGPFGSTPRCIIVAHGSIVSFIPDISMKLFSAIFCIMTAITIWKSKYVVEFLGKILTPLLVISIAILVICGFTEAPDGNGINNDISGTKALLLGLSEGYQTSDLLASFIFAPIIVRYFQRINISEKNANMMKDMFYASIIGGAILFLVYHGFVYLGAHYSNLLQDIPKERGVVHIAKHILPHDAAGIIVCTLVVLACFTTAVTLSMVFADLINEYFLHKLPLGASISILITVTMNFLISLTGFNNLSTYYGLILSTFYPALIVFSICRVIEYKYEFKKNCSKLLFAVAIIITICSRITTI